MEMAVDLHIHSALSACSDKDMTPNNIINMSLLKGLDIIAVVDHNTAGNTEAVLKCARGKSVLAVPGLEVETAEEVHLLCLFPNLEAVLQMEELVKGNLPLIKNREDIFGEQLLIDDNDCITGRLEQFLLTAVSLDIRNIIDETERLGGIAIPAHVDRDSYSIISNLGTIPEDLDIKCVEVSHGCDMKEFAKTHPYIEDYRVIRSSDAHSLGGIMEREFFIGLREKSLECLIEKLKS